MIKRIEKIEFKRTLTTLIYGPKGVGKTTLALSADTNSLLIDTDNGVDRVNVEHLLTAGFIQVRSYAEVLKDLQENAGEFSTIIIDTLGKLIEYMIEYVRSLSTKNCNPQGGLSISGWGILNATFKDFCRNVRLMNKNLIFVAHEIAEKRDDNIRLIPDVRANNYALLSTELDLIGYIECIGADRTISFNPTSEHDGKNTGGFEHQIKIPLLVAGTSNNFFEKNVIEKHFQNVENKVKVQEKYASTIKKIDELIEAVNSANGANIFTGEMKDFEHIGTSSFYAKKKFTEKIRELGLKFNKETNLYEEDSNGN